MTILTGPAATPGLAGEPFEEDGRRLIHGFPLLRLAHGGDGTRLDDVEVGIFSGPLDVLGYAVVLLQAAGDLRQLHDLIVGELLAAAEGRWNLHPDVVAQLLVSLARE